MSARFAALPKRAHVPDFEGRAEIESYTVDVQTSGPIKATFSALNEAGERVWGRSQDPSVMRALLDDEDACGRSASIRQGLVDLG